MLGAFVACFIATKTRSHQEGELGGVVHSAPLLQKTFVPWSLCGLLYCDEDTKSPRGVLGSVMHSVPLLQKTFVPWSLCGLLYCDEDTKSPRGVLGSVMHSVPLLQKTFVPWSLCGQALIADENSEDTTKLIR
ncbi:hypothetical protein [Echinicola rosea]|uniref:hypothetical protein n=1 Tax=Echinicola rosea TaxID=1807691 RepID=UPI0010CA756A|nr:hypothetical protein [Echinicola rosea]